LGIRNANSLEVSFNGDPKLARRLIIFHGEIQDRDGGIQLAANAAVCFAPSSVDGIGGRSPGDVTYEAKLAAHGLEERAPLALGGAEFQRHGDVGLTEMGA